MKIYQYLSAAALLVLTACAGDDLMKTAAGDSPLLQMTATQTNSLTGQLNQTRAIDGLLTATTGFVGTESVKVYFNETSDDYFVSPADASNSYQSTLYGGELGYPSAITGTAALYAVHPAASATVGAHTVAYDQTGTEGYRQSDLMYAKQTVDLTEKTAVQNLVFDHQLVKLKLLVTKGADVTALTKIEMKNVKRTVAITPSASALTQGALTTAADDNGDKILVFQGNMTTSNEQQIYSCVFPAQEWDGTDFIELTVDGHPIVYTLDKDNWTAGAEYTLTINIDYALLNSTVAINAWFEGDDLTVITAPESLSKLKVWINSGKNYDTYLGYYVRKNGSIRATHQNGDVGCIAYISTTDVDVNIPNSRIIVVALSNASTSSQWGSSGTLRDLTDATALNGYSNTNTLRQLGQSAHPAAYAAWNHTGAMTNGASHWFLPSEAQLDNMKAVIKDKLGINSGTFWSSTEADAANARAYSFYTNSWSTYAKTSTNVVRTCFVY